MDLSTILYSSNYREALFEYAAGGPLGQRPFRIDISPLLDVSSVFSTTNFFCCKCRQGFTNHDERGSPYQQMEDHIYTTRIHEEDPNISFRRITYYQ